MSSLRVDRNALTIYILLLDVMRSICYTSCHIRLIIYNCSIVIGCVRVMINKLNFISNRVVSRVVGVRWNGGRLDNVISCIRVVEIQPNTTYVNSRSNQGKHTALRRLHSRCSWSASVLMILGLHFWLDFWLAFPLVML